MIKSKFLEKESIIWEEFNKPWFDFALTLTLLISITIASIAVGIVEIIISFLLLITIIPILFLLVFSIHRRFFHIVFTRSYLYIGRITPNKIYEHKHIDYIEIELSDPKSWTTKGRYYEQVKTTLHLKFYNHPKLKRFRFIACYEASSRILGRNKARTRARNQRIRFKNRINELPNIFLDYVKVNDYSY